MELGKAPRHFKISADIHCAISGDIASNSDADGLEVAGDVISGVTVDYVGMDVRVKLDVSSATAKVLDLCQFDRFEALLCSILQPTGSR